MTLANNNGLRADQSARFGADWLTTAQLIFSALFTLFYGGVSVVMFAFSLPEVRSATASNPTPLFGYSMGIICAILALFNLASAYYAGKALQLGVDSIRTEKRMRWLNALIALLPFNLIVGALVFSNQTLRNYLLPVLTSLSLTIGVIWLIRVGSKNLWGNHPQRDSGLISLMSGFTVWFIMFLEMMVMLMMGVMLFAGVMTNPDLFNRFEQLLPLFQQANPDTESLMRALEGMVSLPLLIGGAMFLIAGILPVIEELFKTIGVWMLSGRKLTPQEGWTAGLMSGAGFALVEGLFYGLQMTMAPDATTWISTLIGRTGGTILHTLFGGMVGLAYARSWRDGKAGRVLGVYVAVIAMHGLWNALAIAQGALALGGKSAMATNWMYLPLGLMMVIMLIAYLAKSRKLERP